MIGAELDMGAYEVQHCFGDFDNSGLVDGADLGTLLGDWGTCVGCQTDLNGDGVVDGADLGLLLGAWGTSCSYGLLIGGGGSGLSELLYYLGAESIEEATEILGSMDFEEMNAILQAFLGT